MGYYDSDENVEQYIHMAEGYDGKLLIAALSQHIDAGASVIELGMGGGKDYLLLSETYQVTGSDYSAAFIERFRKQHPDADLLQLDAVTLDTDRQFDAIYSNKVLYHLTLDELKQSFVRQHAILNPNGIAMHSFWYGDSTDDMHGLHFAYYTDETLKATLPDGFEVVNTQRYTEMETDDSLYIVIKKKS